MRVLFTTTPDKSLFQQMVPLAWALRTAGHEVRVASQPKFADTVTQAGLTAVPVGHERDIWRLAQMDPEEREAGRKGLPSPFHAAEGALEDLDWQTLKEGYEEAVQWHKFDNFPMIADLVAYARHWKPDLVIWEPWTYAGAIAAKATGAAHARLLWSIDVLGLTRTRYLELNSRQPEADRADPLADWLASYAHKYGGGEYSEDMATGHFSIDQFPTSLRMEGEGLRYEPMRYVPYGGPVSVPRWLWDEPARPRIALTLGIAATNLFAGYIADVSDILESLADLDVEVVATIAESEQHKLARVPENVRVVSYVPLHALLPTCTAVIHHAGPGTFLTTALNPVPQVAVPWDFDEPELARRAAEQGSLLSIRADRATGAAVREALLRVLNEPGFRAAATELRDQFRALPTPNELVPRLEELTAEFRSPTA
ncbi:activator-dependent family glycosyltransferase [Streptomyces salinarius]|uniref:activator-dependent family glycosyltransferase n=1 Tax=Streptomyces salinarius TaxID=2762598 RepID=UPI001644FA6F|nr:activator-dependent family glycosyltransferase [Streptomyces salinarius]